MSKNYYDVLVFNEDTGLNQEVLKKVSYRVANLKTLALRSQGKKADIWYNFNKYATTEITKDNLHLYYEFMSDEDIKKYRHIVIHMFNERLETINKSIKLDAMYISAISLSVFDVKDTLKPIDEYIAEIKASKEYQAYIFNLDFDNLDFDNWNSLRNFIEKYRKVHINLMEHIDSLRYIAKQIKDAYISSKLAK